MKKLTISSAFVLIWLSGMGLGVKSARANLSYNGGYYTNLCGGGTAANTYSCNMSCAPTSGMCQSNNGGAVRYICSGKWTGCLESETWGNAAQLGQVSCGNTVQLSLYDKKCRQDDGSWDSSCNLLGYMVWYSGDCWGNTTPPPLNSQPTATPIPLATAVPTSRVATPTVTPTLKPTASPTPTVINSVQVICNKSCVMDSECGAGFGCVAGYCRNPICESDSTCFCSTKTATPAATGKGGTPETGISSWLGAVGMLLLAGAGWRMTKAADKLWG